MQRIKCLQNRHPTASHASGAWRLCNYFIAFFLIGQKTSPISSLEGDDALTLIIFTSLLDFAGP
jgi:hypothetical protein